MDVHEYDIVLEIETFWQLSCSSSDPLDSIDELPAPIDYAAEANNDVKNKENDQTNDTAGLGWPVLFPAMKTFKFRNSSSERAEINIDQLKGAAAVAYDICTGRITVPAEQRTAEQISGNRLRTMFIAVLGLYNKGKTFVLNRLAKTKLPESALHRTKGISLKTSADEGLSKFTLVDIAGFDAPVEVISRNAVKHKKCVDHFIEHLAIALSTVTIVVVSDMTLSDQVYLEDLRLAKQRYRNNLTDLATGKDTKETISVHDKFDDLIVIHNFPLSSSVDEGQKRFQDQVVETYKRQGHWIDYHSTQRGGLKQRFFYTNMIPGSKVGMRHVFVVREPEKPSLSPLTESGKAKAHNGAIFKMIYQWIQGQTSESEVEPVSHIVKKANELLPAYFDNPPKVDLVKRGSNFYISSTCGWPKNCLKDPEAKPNVLSPGLYEGLAKNVEAPRPLLPFNYDILNGPDSITILMEAKHASPTVQFDPRKNVCEIKGKIDKPKLYDSPGTNVPRQTLHYGEYEILIDLAEHLPHFDLALEYRRSIKSKDGFFAVQFRKLSSTKTETVEEVDRL
ncbi:uncharacterized protein [Oscarella lobularis]|uniref:uncharacterized protein isoform X1 n=1 Tax=Oscarella lobularis TaxID=121494 RepID=UPI0033134DF2